MTREEMEQFVLETDASKDKSMEAINKILHAKLDKELLIKAKVREYCTNEKALIEMSSTSIQHMFVTRALNDVEQILKGSEVE